MIRMDAIQMSEMEAGEEGKRDGEPDKLEEEGQRAARVG